IRSAAVRNLSALLDDEIAKKDPAIIRALLPWLENPKWAKEAENERVKIVAALRMFAIPESVPGLIAMLNEKEKSEITVMTDGVVRNGNVAVSSNANSAGVKTVDTYPYR